ncbi:MAG: Gfo/Idh/MocA family oxidoreductase [Candidatus Hydrogenedentes bacterium]|nr:Gfo/Idh/MocA family oxidoreductase [Candidatus Hydrogenedentota bacterium]
MRELRVGLVGCGQHALMYLLPALHYAPIQLVSVCDTNAERRLRAKRQFGAEADFEGIGAMLRGPTIDAVIACGPPDMHRAAAIAAMDAGLNVFVEKPPANDLAGAMQIAEASRANGRHCMVGFMKRFALRYRQARELAQRRAFGKTTHVSIKYAHWNCPDLHWMLVYMTVHTLDLMRFFAGELARMSIERAETAGQFTFTVQAVSASGTLVSLVTSSQEPRVKEHVEITGEGEVVVVRNVIELEYHRRVSPTKLFTSDLHDVQLLRPDFAIPNPEQNTLFLQGYAGEMQEFASACIEERAPSVTIADGVQAMRLAQLLARNTTGSFDLME